MPLFTEYNSRNDRYPEWSRSASPIAYAKGRYGKSGLLDLPIVRVEREETPDGTVVYHAIRADKTRAGSFVERGD
jgi:hypothetical protein